MDQTFIEGLKAAGLPLHIDELNRCVKSSDEGALSMVVGEPGKEFPLQLKSCAELFTGTRQPPPMSGGPPPDWYISFFVAIEQSVALACRLRRSAESDDEFERLYRYMKKRPDGIDRNPMFAVIQQAARLYMSLHDTSQAEFEAVMDWLSRSARTFSIGTGSRNYFVNVLEPLL